MPPQVILMGQRRRADTFLSRSIVLLEPVGDDVRFKRERLLFSMADSRAFSCLSLELGFLIHLE